MKLDFFINIYNVKRPIFEKIYNDTKIIKTIYNDEIDRINTLVISTIPRLVNFV
jgi:hypothetical protein